MRGDRLAQAWQAGQGVPLRWLAAEPVLYWSLGSEHAAELPGGGTDLSSSTVSCRLAGRDCGFGLPPGRLGHAQIPGIVTAELSRQGGGPVGRYLLLRRAQVSGVVPNR